MTSFFPPTPAGVNPVIDADHGIVTVVSGSSKTGGHASLWIERLAGGEPEMIELELTTSGYFFTVPDINVEIYQGYEGGEAWDLEYEKQQWCLNCTRHSYDATTAQTHAIMQAVTRFQNKNASGRYRYVLPGGHVGRLFTAPGRRGVNCADFVMKVLAEAGIDDVACMLVDLPRRLTRT
ncbi:MAG: hypothetical protein ACYTJ0_19060 [Planctomycetota bacterium]|jgi:hypothetical protein